jgi:peptidoglycan/xylan/chitin deacetylase (PgdA/CDA1 family)
MLRQLLIKLLLNLLFVGSLFADGHIFIYHRFDEVKYPSTSIDTKDLEKQFEYFKKNGYTVVPLEKMLDLVKQKKDVPQKWIALTIDDSYKSFYTHGLKVFKKYDYPFTLFVYVKATNDRYGDFMTWDELKQMKKHKGDIQYHSYAHPHMARLSNEELREDFKKGLSIFEKNMGYKPKYFTFPYGEYNKRVQDISKKFGFEALLNQNNLCAVSANNDMYDIDRSGLVSGYKYVLTLKDLKAKLIKPVAYPKDKVLKEVVFQIPKKYKKAEIYVSRLGWQWADVKDGVATLKVDKKLQTSSLRVAVKVGKKIKTKIIVKGN